jgi:Sec-independent protein translocase protein TatA
MGMNVFGVGPSEFFLLLVIALLILGPERMVKASQGIARLIRNLILSPAWRTIQQVQAEVRNLPTQLIREAGLEDMDKIVPTPAELAKSAGFDELARDVNQIQKQVRGDITAANNQISSLTQQASRPASSQPVKVSPVSSPPASPANTGAPTVSVLPPAPPSPSGPPTIQKK